MVRVGAGKVIWVCMCVCVCTYIVCVFYRVLFVYIFLGLKVTVWLCEALRRIHYIMSFQVDAFFHSILKLLYHIDLDLHTHSNTRTSL